MKIKNWEHAIDLTIDLHRKAIDLDLGYLGYAEVKANNKPQRWDYSCPLCQYAYELKRELNEKHACSFCPWVKITGQTCIMSELDFDDNVQSIKRLEEWKLKIKEDESKK